MGRIDANEQRAVFNNTYMGDCKKIHSTVNNSTTNGNRGWIEPHD